MSIFRGAFLIPKCSCSDTLGWLYQNPYRAFKMSLRGISLVWNWYGTMCNFFIRKDTTKVPYFASKKFRLMNLLNAQHKYGTSMELSVLRSKYAYFGITMLLKSVILRSFYPTSPIQIWVLAPLIKGLNKHLKKRFFNN